ncbi:hypothetical protein ABS71_10345 [bacterium SCN 62-11]|nr:hypothetical protein [Candidatus Eremiobacteraeota bacterium]ODT67772.1 MAG: hypothetical protein ABS71_10345 [bacterium SCN 62-11]
MNPPAESESPSLGQLARQLVPLSLSDAAMALADPLLAVTLTRLPSPEVQLAALGVVKALANFLESPIIMVLHASTALSGWARSRTALGRFVLLLASLLTVLFLSLSLPSVHHWLTADVYSLVPEVAAATRWPLLIMCLWPAVIALRRIHQGQLILQGRGKFMGMASLLRVAAFSLTLFLGGFWGLPGATLGALATMGGLWVEALLVVRWTRQQALIDREPAAPLPTDLPGVSRYYAPLALTMLLMWGGRAALVAVLARAQDSELALAAWSASWGFVILIANLSRMVQQLVIKYARQVPAARLAGLGLLAGGSCSFLLTLLGHTGPGQQLLALLIGGDPRLLVAAEAVVGYSLLVPLLVAAQNVLQGFCIVVGRNTWVNGAGLVGVSLTLLAAHWGVQQGWPGASVGAGAVALGLLAEVALLAAFRPWKSIA